MAGRRTKLKPKVFDAIVGGVRTGATLVIAAKAAGIPEKTALEWYARGRGEDPVRPTTKLYAEFASKIDEAEAAAAMDALSAIEKLKNGGWLKTKQRITENADGTREIMNETEEAAPMLAAATWWLERRMPNEFGRVDRLRVDVNVLRAEAERIAKESGLSVDQVLAEAEAIVNGR